LAIALSELGMEVTVLERSPAPAVEVGGGLGVDIDLLRQVTGIREEPPALHGIDRDTTAWHLLQGWLEAHAVRRPGVSVHRGTEVTTVHPGNDHQPARVVAAGGGEFSADLVIGAGPYRLVTYLVPGAAGETRVGHRRLNLVWYDPEQGGLLRDMGLLDGETVHGSLAPGALPPSVLERLSAFAAANWPSPWREALAIALHNGTVFGTPIVHYEPVRLVNGRTALAGDAAHAASPMVGGGFRQGLYDVRTLSQVMAGLAAHGDVPGALGRYQRQRLGPAGQHVAISERATAAYLADAGARPAQ
jgi:2-polyprenyl-6-methoxyphenol hydroxylase-like FAD-dependent oxidoreductase